MPSKRRNRRSKRSHDANSKAREPVVIAGAEDAPLVASNGVNPENTEATAAVDDSTLIVNKEAIKETAEAEAEAEIETPAVSNGETPEVPEETETEAAGEYLDSAKVPAQPLVTTEHETLAKNETNVTAGEAEDETIVVNNLEEQKKRPPDEDEQRLRAYEMVDASGDSETKQQQPERTGNLRMGRVSRRVRRELSRGQSTVIESLPETTTGWIALVASMAASLLAYEVRLQKSLTSPPLVFGQCQSGPMADIYSKMTATPDSILSRDIQPSLFVGTRGLVSSTAAFLMGGPTETKRHVRFRQILNMTQDGAQLALDWELPPNTTAATEQERQHNILKGPIQQPVVLILHGINNDTTFGYMRSLMRTCTDRGWVAVGMNFRGCGGVPLTTPRGYNGAYTGDLRCVVQSIAERMADGAPMFLVGNSLGANLLIKYLGEEGMSGTLPSCVAGSISLGNPLAIDSTKTSSIISAGMALGVKKTMLQNWKSTHRMAMESSQFRTAMRKGYLAPTLAQFDDAAAPIFARNDPVAPFGFRVGFKDGNAYWTDASSYRLIRFISVPTLQIIAGDDFLVYNASFQKLSFCVANPNVMVVETRCGGHLGWQESPPDGKFGAIASWSDAATTDFIQSIIEVRRKKTTAAETGAGSVNKNDSSSLKVSPKASALRSKL